MVTCVSTLMRFVRHAARWHALRTLPSIRKVGCGRRVRGNDFNENMMSGILPLDQHVSILNRTCVVNLIRLPVICVIIYETLSGKPIY